MRTRLVFPAAVMFATAGGMLGGCGSSAPRANGIATKTPAAIVATARAAAARAATVHVVGSILGAGRPISLNMELVGGKGGRGNLALGALGIQLIDLDRSVYVKGGAAFYERFVSPEAARRLRGRWLKGSNRKGPLAALASLAQLPKLIDDALDAHGRLSRGTTTTVRGRRAVGVEDVAGGGTLYVSATGTPYPIQLSRGGLGGLGFYAWNAPVSLAAPANPLNIKQIQNVGNG